ncbi:hypothetical protein GGR58DRAFT_14342 [Xylaria digitata]|nr:hypothetical protein GGR58DRAFT_14342 [Xylaria digitata]
MSLKQRPLFDCPRASPASYKTSRFHVLQILCLVESKIPTVILPAHIVPPPLVNRPIKSDLLPTKFLFPCVYYSFMSIGIQDLSGELVVRITKVLARRPEYGIAVPSRRWLQRQEEKMKNLPKELLRPSSLKRLALKIADRIDPNIVDPQAVLCKTHSTLNPFLIRRLFIALAYEVTVHTDSLRSWQGRISDPELSAFVGRLDSIAALWTAPPLFHEIYGLAPFDGRHVFVKSACEACCLAAVGASGRALADLRAALIDRMERRGGKGKEPRLYRVVEAWIDHLRKHDDNVNRPEYCRASSESLLVDLRMARPQIKAWRAQQKKHHAELRAARRPIYAELKRSRSGAKISSLPHDASRKRRTRNGIPVALVDINGAQSQRRAAMSSIRRDSIYRPDSIAGFSGIHERQKAAYSLPTEARPRPSALEPVRLSGPSVGSPTQSFLYRFEQEMPTVDEREPYDDIEERELDEDESVEESRVGVRDWWTSKVCRSQLDLNQDDTKSVLSMVHPAFRPSASHAAAPATPTPPHSNDPETRANNPGGRRQTTASVWTDCTAYTLGPGSAEPNHTNAPPVPRVPSEYRNNRHSLRNSDGTPQVASHTPAGGTYVRPTVEDERQSTVPFPEYRDPLVNQQTSRRSISSSSSKTKGRKTPLNWPAPPQGRYPPSTRDNPRLRKESDVGSTLSEQRYAFLAERFKPKEERRHSLIPETPTQTPASPDISHSRPVSYASSSVYSVASMVPSLDSSHGNTFESESDGDTTPTQRGRLGSFPSSESDVILPDDSISNVNWKRQRRQSPGVSSVTQLGDDWRKM